MKVYILQHFRSYDNTDILSVHSTRESARAAMLREADEHRHEPCHVEADCIEYSDWNLGVSEWEVCK